MSDPVLTQRARLAANLRHHPDADHTESRRDLAAANLEQYINKVVAEAPPLTSEQVNRLRILLEPARRDLARKGGLAKP